MSEVTPTIIFLNGATGSGKTSTALCLQEILEPAYLYVRSDSFLKMLPASLVGPNPEGVVLSTSYDEGGKPSISVDFGPQGEKLVQAYLETLLMLSKADMHFIADFILSRDKDLKALVEAFFQKRAYFVRLYAPLEILETREKKRYEPLGLARGRYRAVYERDIEYDLKIDTSKVSAMDAAQEIAKMITTREPRALKNMLKKQ